MTVKRWFRLVRAASWKQWYLPEVTIRFSTEHRTYRAIEFDVRDWHDLRALVDNPPSLSLPTYARIIGMSPSVEMTLRMRELMRGIAE